MIINKRTSNDQKYIEEKIVSISLKKVDERGRDKESIIMTKNQNLNNLNILIFSKDRILREPIPLYKKNDTINREEEIIQ